MYTNIRKKQIFHKMKLDLIITLTSYGQLLSLFILRLTKVINNCSSCSHVTDIKRVKSRENTLTKNRRSILAYTLYLDNHWQKRYNLKGYLYNTGD